MEKIHPLLGSWQQDPEITPIRSGGSTGKVGHFGLTRDGGTKMHKGIDILSVVGWPVFAMHRGAIGPLCGWQDHNDQSKGYGLRCYILGDEQTESRYAHLDVILVHAGDVVDAGDLIGRVGRTGNVGDNPTHLHAEIRINGAPVDPLAWLREDQ